MHLPGSEGIGSLIAAVETVCNWPERGTLPLLEAALVDEVEADEAVFVAEREGGPVASEGPFDLEYEGVGAVM